MRLSFVVSLSLLVITAFFFTPVCSAQVPYETNAYIKDWLILGPFPNAEDVSTTDYHHGDWCTGFYTDYLASIGGEKKAVPEEGMKVTVPEKSIERTWSRLTSADNLIHFSELLNPKDMVIGYAFCQVDCPEAKKVILSVGSNDGVRVFLNGEEVHESHPYFGRWLQGDNDYVPVNLKQGINNLLLKIDQGTGDFGYVVRFLDYDTVVADIRAKLDAYKRLKAVAIEDTLVATFGTMFKISVLNPTGKVQITLHHEKAGKLAEQTVRPGEEAKFQLDPVPEGFLQVKATFPTPEDGVITSETRHYKGKLKRHPRVERMGKDLTVRDAEGNPFFPIGTYGAPVEEYTKLKAAGYNFVVAGADNLDAVHEAGLLAAVPVHGNDAEHYVEYISKYKDHPAVLCWMLYDEPGYNKADLQFIYDIYNAAYEADKVHPSYLVITTPTVYESFGWLCDVLAIDTYPISNGRIDSVGENIALAREQLEAEVPLWHCGQMFAWPNDRRPTPQEHRYMTYCTLMQGVKGMLWYTYRGYGQNLPVDGPELWEAQKVLLAELNELAPLYLEKGFGKELQPLQENDALQAVIKKSPIGTYLIATNHSKTDTVQAAYTVGKKHNGTVEVYNEGRTVTVEGGVLKDTFEPLDVHVYKIN